MADDEIGRQTLACIDPVRAVGEIALVDDDKQIIVRDVAPGRMRLIDPATARIAPVEDDFLRILPRFRSPVAFDLAASNSSNRIWMTRSSSRCLAWGR
jgi:hypothetical protein